MCVVAALIVLIAFVLGLTAHSHLAGGNPEFCLGEHELILIGMEGVIVPQLLAFVGDETMVYGGPGHSKDITEWLKKLVENYRTSARPRKCYKFSLKTVATVRNFGDVMSDPADTPEQLVLYHNAGPVGQTLISDLIQQQQTGKPAGAAAWCNATAVYLEVLMRRLLEERQTVLEWGKRVCI
ncbi:hypothetical protein Pelo_6242 [Pelomyxa schiedti]|nr:hypothetical protein Pelo_6242 [Pelomyxa schiedti]